MKPFLLAMLSASAFAAPHAPAHPPLLHTLQGEVAAVEPERQRFTVRTVKTPAGFHVSWGPGTQFFRDGKIAPDASLARGQQVTVRYRAPSFGPRIAGRVFILSTAQFSPRRD